METVWVAWRPRLRFLRNRSRAQAAPRMGCDGGDEQQQVGLYCGDVLATVDQPLRTCTSLRYGSALIHIVPPGTYNSDTNPSRIRPRNVFDIAVGADNLWKNDTYSLGAKVTVVNLLNKVALYNFLSSFSGTHFIAPRTLQAAIDFHF
jgi:hypothetical protein